MSWFDVVKQRRAKLEATQKAQAEKDEARKAQIEVNLEAKEKRRRNKEMAKARTRIKSRLPVGVEIVGAHYRTDRPVVSVDLGNGVRLDLALRHVYYSRNYGSDNWPRYSHSEWDEVDIYTAGNPDRNGFLRSSRLERGPLEEALYDALPLYGEHRPKNSTQ